MASQYHDAPRTDEDRRRNALCWLHTRQRNPELVARTLAQLPNAERARVEYDMSRVNHGTQRDD